MLVDCTLRFLRTSQLFLPAAGKVFGITTLKRPHRSPWSSVSLTGEVAGAYVFKSGNPARFVARVVDSTVSFGRPVKFTFKLRPDGKMEATGTLPANWRRQFSAAISFFW